MDHWNTISFVFRELSSGTLSLLGRLQHLSDWRNQNDGLYRHAALELALGPKETHAACDIVHRLVWSDWIRSSLEQQKADLLAYLTGVSEPNKLLSAWRAAPPILLWAPSGSRIEEQQLAASNFEVVVTLLCRSGSIEQLTGLTRDRRRAEPLITQILAQIEETYASPMLSLATIGCAFCISERHAARLLKSHTGMTFTCYVRMLRMQRAKYLLTTSHASIKAVCAAVGYHEVSWFVRYFRAINGCTPSEFRKKEFLFGAQFPGVSDCA